MHVLQVPGARLALVGDGPQRQELEQMFRGMPVKFMVRLQAQHSVVQKHSVCALHVNTVTDASNLCTHTLVLSNPHTLAPASC